MLRNIPKRIRSVVSSRFIIRLQWMMAVSILYVGCEGCSSTTTPASVLVGPTTRESDKYQPKMLYVTQQALVVCTFVKPRMAAQEGLWLTSQEFVVPSPSIKIHGVMEQGTVIRLSEIRYHWTVDMGLTSVIARVESGRFRGRHVELRIISLEVPGRPPVYPIYYPNPKFLKRLTH